MLSNNNFQHAVCPEVSYWRTYDQLPTLHNWPMRLAVQTITCCTVLPVTYCRCIIIPTKAELCKQSISVIHTIRYKIIVDLRHSWSWLHLTFIGWIDDRRHEKASNMTVKFWGGAGCPLSMTSIIRQGLYRRPIVAQWHCLRLKRTRNVLTLNSLQQKIWPLKSTRQVFNTLQTIYSDCYAKSNSLKTHHIANVVGWKAIISLSDN